MRRTKKCTASPHDVLHVRGISEGDSLVAAVRPVDAVLGGDVGTGAAGLEQESVAIVPEKQA